MDVLVRFDGDETGEALRSLNSWLQDDEDLRGVRIKVLNSPTHPEDMGPVSDAIQALFEQQDLLVALAQVIGAWVTTRRRSVRLRVRNGDQEVEIDAAEVNDPEEVAARILHELRKP